MLIINRTVLSFGVDANIIIITVIFIVINLGVNGLLRSLVSILTGQVLNIHCIVFKGDLS